MKANLPVTFGCYTSSHSHTKTDSYCDASDQPVITRQPAAWLMSLTSARQNHLPVQKRVPQQSMIPAIHVAMHGIEIERDHVAAAYRHIQNRGAPHQTALSPYLTAYEQWRPVAIAPFGHDATGIFRPVSTRRFCAQGSGAWNLLSPAKLGDRAANCVTRMCLFGNIENSHFDVPCS